MGNYNSIAFKWIAPDPLDGMSTNGLMLSGNKPLPKPVLMVHDAIWGP